MKTLETFYGECIESKIVQCDLKARANGRSHCSKGQARLRLAQAAFLEDQKERLVQEMIKLDLGMDLSKINSFLNESFFLTFRARVYSDGSGQDFGGIHQFPELSSCVEEVVRKMREPTSRSNVNDAYQEHLSKLFEPPWSDGSLIADEDEDDAYV